MRLIRKLKFFLQKKLRFRIKKPKFKIGESVILTIIEKPVFKGVIIYINDKYEDLIGLSDFKPYQCEVRFRVRFNGQKVSVSYPFYETILNPHRILLTERTPTYFI